MIWCLVWSQDTAIKASNVDDMFKYKSPPAIDEEPEERRMSDLSDWASSVTSSVDIQVITFRLIYVFI